MITNLVKGGVFIILLGLVYPVLGQVDKKNTFLTPPNYIQRNPSPNSFRIAENHTTAEIFVDPSDWKGVLRAANDLGDDVRKVTGKASAVVQEVKFRKGGILIGTIGKSRIIDQLIAEKKLDVSQARRKGKGILLGHFRQMGC